MQYHNLRNAYHNQEKVVFEGVGQYGIPPLPPVELPLGDVRLERFDLCTKERHPEDKIVHFFTDDWRFERLWREPERYLRMLARFKAVIAPDFSLYSDFPKATQIYSHFKKHWIGAWLSSLGVTVIPNIRWLECDPSSLDWTLDGEPHGGTVCISTHGCIKGGRRKEGFLECWEKAISILCPDRILLFGDTFPGLDFHGELVHVTNEQMVYRRRYCRRWDQEGAAREGAQGTTGTGSPTLQGDTQS